MFFLLSIALPIVNASTNMSKIDVGQTASLIAVPTGGTPPYTYQWYNTTTGTAVKIASATQNTLQVQGAIAGAFSYFVSMTDSVSVTVNSLPANVEVFNAPTISLVPSTPVILQGMQETYTVRAFNGVGPFSIELYNITGNSQQDTNVTIQSPGGSNTISFIVSKPGSFTYNAIATDTGTKHPFMFASTSNTITVATTGNFFVGLSNLVIDFGQTTTLVANVIGGTAPYTYQWKINGNNVGGNSNSLTFNGNSTMLSSSPDNILVMVTDNLGRMVANHSIVTVNNALGLGSPSVIVSSNTIYNGQTAALTANVNGGTAPYTFVWTYNGNVIGTNSSTLLFNGNATTLAQSPNTVNVLVKDSTGSSISGSAKITVIAAPTLALTPSDTIFDSGQSVTFLLGVTGGVGPFNIELYNVTGSKQQGTNVTIQSPAGTNTIAFVTNYQSSNSASFATLTYNAFATDLGIPAHPAFMSPQTTILIHTAPSVNITSDPNIDIGQSLSLTAHPTGGTPPYTFKWYNDTSGTPVPVSNSIGGNTITVTIPGSVVGNYVYYVAMRDSANVPNTTYSSNAIMHVFSALSPPSILPTSARIDSGQNLSLNATGAGGTGTYGWQWFNDSNAITGANSNVLHISPSGTIGSTFTYFTVENDLGSEGSPPVNSISHSVTAQIVGNAFSVKITNPNQTITTGDTVTYFANVTGGTGNYLYDWYNTTTGNIISSSVSNSLSNSITITGSATGTFKYYVTVTDLGTSPNAMASSNTMLTVNPVPPPPPSTGAGPGGGGGVPASTFVPSVIHTSANCFQVTNLTSPDYAYVNFTGISLMIRANFISPTGTGISVNNQSEFLDLNSSITLPEDTALYTGITITLPAISYIPAVHTVVLGVCAIPRNVATNSSTGGVPSNSSRTGTTIPTLNLTITNTTITLSSSNPNSLIELLANGTAIDTGTGRLSYNASQLSAGTYAIQGRIPSLGISTAAKAFSKAFIVPYLAFTHACSNMTYNGLNPCTTIAVISSSDNQLLGRLYLNGNLIGQTNSTINNTASKPGTYDYAFNTLGNSNYTQNNISYSFVVSNSLKSIVKSGKLSPALLALLIAIAAAIAIGGAYYGTRRKKSNEEEQELSQLVSSGSTGAAAASPPSGIETQEVANTQAQPSEPVQIQSETPQAPENNEREVSV